MNEAPNSNTGLNDSFSSQSTPQSNPFTADLKGEFTSNFGTNTNAVSQIFKEGGFASNNKTKSIVLGGVLFAVICVALFMYISGDDSESTGEDVAAETDAEGGGDDAEDQADATTSESKTEEKTKPEAPAAVAATPAAAPAQAAPAPASTAAPRAQRSFSASSGPISLAEPADGSSITYDESQGPATFSWSGGSGYIVFSRSSSMSPVVMRVPVSGSSYNFNHPWPGTWYWKVENNSGATEVRSFKVSAPPRRTIALQQPASGSTIAGTGGTVAWQGDSKVAYYRVEFTNGSWANPQYRFASSGNSLQLQGVPAGQFQMRLGAFSEISGRWEYTPPVSVTVQ
ncbi:MAG: hypothetical protein RL011_1030 [Pseudomonadota bacterium]